MYNKDIERILIYRLGSLGDAIVALPSLKLIAEAFPSAKTVAAYEFQHFRKSSADVSGF